MRLADHILVVLGDVVMRFSVGMGRVGMRFNVAMGRVGMCFGIHVRNYRIYVRHILKLPLPSDSRRRFASRCALRTHIVKK
jgi:hypothetical protein